MKKTAVRFFLIGALCIFFRTVHAQDNQTIDFLLKAHVFDYGQRIIGLELETEKFEYPVKKSTLNKKTFSVIATGTIPDFATGGEKTIFSSERKVKNIFINQTGNIELEFDFGQNILESNTIVWEGGDVSRNILLNLKYEIIQKKDFALANNTKIAHAVFIQSRLVDTETDRFAFKTSSTNLQYRFFTPQKNSIGEKKPLIIWLHGTGEGGYKDHQNNYAQITANRGGVGFITEEAQRLFNGAYVIAPQVTDAWYNNYSKGYNQQLKTLIDEVVLANNIDKTRIYLFGASAGGYMTVRMVMEYPTFFAAAIPICPAIDLAESRGGKPTSDEEILLLKSTPLWLIHAENDPTVSFLQSTKRIADIFAGKGIKTSVYPNVKIANTEYDGHQSWIYASRNMPSQEGQSIFEWTASQKR